MLSTALVGGLHRNIYAIYLTNWVHTIQGSVFNILLGWLFGHISGNYDDVNSNVETMLFVIFLSKYSGGKDVIYEIYNKSNDRTVSYSIANIVYNNGWNGIGGASSKVCVIENRYKSY